MYGLPGLDVQTLHYMLKPPHI